MDRHRAAEVIRDGAVDVVLLAFPAWFGEAYCGKIGNERAAETERGRSESETKLMIKSLEISAKLTKIERK